MKKPQFETLRLEKIVGGGQALGEIGDGRKAFVWGGLPGELVKIRITKKKSHFVEGVVTEIIEPAQERIAPRDPESFLSTSPWQIMLSHLEQHYKSALIEEAFELHNIVLPNPIDVFADGENYNYRNKVEFSWFSEAQDAGDSLDLAFFRRGSKGKIVVDSTSLARPEINILAQTIRDFLRRKKISARQLKTLLIRCDQRGNCVWQLYTKEKLPEIITPSDAANFPAQGGEVIFSNPQSPASVITERLASFGATTLTDKILETPFNYACEGFFQINVPVYEQALRDMQKWASGAAKIVDLYSGVGTIGLTISKDNDLTLVEINESAVAEMRRNITELKRSNARAALAASENALDFIDGEALIVVDPPRAGLHASVISRLLETAPARIIYLSCNPVTQARDVALLAEKYGIRAHRGYNFFPRTPHIENLIVLDRR